MKVYLDSVGCRLNQSEIEQYARQFRSAGHTLVSGPAGADLMVLNTCAVTASAAADSRKKVRQARRAGVGEIRLTGCWSDLEPEAAARLPGVAAVVPNQRKDHLVADLLQIDFDTFDYEPIERQPLPGSRAKTRAYIKVQDGCDNRCTFCVTTIARGEGRSRPVAAIRADIRAALAGGAKEIVLTGVHLGSWGQDFERPRHLRDLVTELLMMPDLPRLRLSSLEPWDLDADFFALWQDSRLCRHLHLPLQSGSAATLRRMARNPTPAKFAALVDAARKAIPEVAITTDLIAGFPGETEAEFQQTLAFVAQMHFADAHVFTYSERPDTAAASMPGPVPHAVRKERSAQLRARVAESGAAYRRAFLGREIAVLWEGEEALESGGWRMSGLTDNYLRVEAASERPRWNQIDRVQLTALAPGGLRGSLRTAPEALWFAAAQMEEAYE
jgi:threonylcarbamoyladenosine tRNA methylthiotransferase MtaB